MSDFFNKHFLVAGKGVSGTGAKECLLKPHTVEYEVREVYICDPSNELATLTEDEFLYLFDLLAITYDPAQLFKDKPEEWKNREIAFDLFWKNGDEWRYA